jgi:UDP-glucose 4-epimerase
MKAIVFGGSGFIGSYLVRELIEQRHIVINFDIKPYDFDNEVRYSFFKGNISSDSELIVSIISGRVPETVYILSARSDIKQCSNDPELAFSVNVMGLINILESVANLKDRESYKVGKNSFGRIAMPKVVFASSLYAVSADHPYGMTKMVGERLVKWYARKFGFPYLILRFGSVYGPGADKNNGIRKLIEKSLRNSKMVHYGTGEELREYVHVRDVAKACVDLTVNDNVTMVISGLTTVRSEILCDMVKEILFPLQDVETEFKGDKPEDHYFKTPYRFRENEVMKYVPKESVDFGYGLVEVIEEVKKSSMKETEKKVV